MDTFKSVDNMKQCLNIFGRYMNDKYLLDIFTLPDTNPRVLLYQIINDITNNPAYVNFTIKELNNVAMNEMRNVYVDKYSLTENKKLHVGSLDREKQVHGSRKVSDVQLKPINTKADYGTNKPIDKEFDRLMALRKGEDPLERAPPPTTDQPMKEKALSNEEFQSKLTEVEKARSDLMASSIDISKMHEKADPKAFFASVLEAHNQKEVAHQQQLINDTDKKFAPTPTPSYEHHARKDLIPVSKFREGPYTYVMINGTDRDWESNRNRFQFSIDMSSMNKTYKNVCELKCTRLIIPSEIMEERSVTNVPKTAFVHNFKFGYPYLLLMLDEFSDVYDGKSNAHQRAFTQFIFDKSYNAPNGRGYITLIPAQDEKKVFYPNPIASLQRLSITIAKPNGTLFNNSQDANHVWKIEYEDYNRLTLKIVLEKYFDRNEFFAGDTILIRNFKMPFYKNEGSPEYNDYISNKYVYDTIMDFVNHPEGHDVAEIGKANEEGFYRTFYISAPMKMDTTQGKYIVNQAMIDTIQRYNEQNYACCTSPTPVGSIINSSLQFSLSMSVKMAVGDAVDALTPQIV